MEPCYWRKVSIACPNQTYTNIPTTRCGICGDPWDASMRDHEAPGGKYANGIITRTFSPGQEISVKTHITANHLGFVELRLCRNNDVTQDPGQSCFDQPGAALTFVSTGEDK